MDNVALFFHLLGALLFVAGIVLAGAAFEAARRRERPAEIALLLGLTRVGVVLVLAGALLLLAFGLWLVVPRVTGSRVGSLVVGGVLLDVVLPLGRHLVLGGDRVDGARLHAGVAVDALLGVDVELLGFFESGLLRGRMDAVHRADLYA
jgi:hypothetical protein